MWKGTNLYLLRAYNWKYVIMIACQVCIVPVFTPITIDRWMEKGWDLTRIKSFFFHWYTCVVFFFFCSVDSLIDLSLTELNWCGIRTKCHFIIAWMLLGRNVWITNGKCIVIGRSLIVCIQSNHEHGSSAQTCFILIAFKWFYVWMPLFSWMQSLHTDLLNIQINQQLSGVKYFMKIKCLSNNCCFVHLLFLFFCCFPNY